MILFYSCLVPCPLLWSWFFFLVLMVSCLRSLIESLFSCFYLLLGSVLSPVLVSHLCLWCFLSYLLSLTALWALNWIDPMMAYLNQSPIHLYSVKSRSLSIRLDLRNQLDYSTYISFIDLFPQFQFLVSLLSTQSLTSIDFLLIL